jgi:hypothetical protein
MKTYTAALRKTLCNNVVKLAHHFSVFFHTPNLPLLSHDGVVANEGEPWSSGVSSSKSVGLLDLPPPSTLRHPSLVSDPSGVDRQEGEKRKGVFPDEQARKRRKMEKTTVIQKYFT